MAHFQGWPSVAQLIDERAQEPTQRLPMNQRAAFAEITRRLHGEFWNAFRGVVISADVEFGKRRLASAIAKAVVDLGGRVAVLTPARHGRRWQQEFGGYEIRPKLVRTLSGYLRQFRQGPWASHAVVLVSHELANWRVDADSDNWRWGLLPELISLHGRAGAGGQYSDGYGHETPWNRPEVVIAAAEIYSLLDAGARTELSDWASRPWRSTYCNAAHYAVGGECREPFERVIGWGLGRFDLIVIDEPRKPRDYEVGLSRLCRHVQGSSECARLALTEIPVTANLHQDQLDRTLAWVAVPSTIRRAAVESGFAFERAWDLLGKNWRSNPDWDGFRSAAADFDAATTPYVAHFRSPRGTSVSPGFRWLDRARVAQHDARAGTCSSPPARIARPWWATADKRSSAPTPLQKFRDGEELPEMVVIPAGDFLMGSPPSEEGRGSDEGPQHRVHVASFAMGCKAVSFAEYDRFVEATGWNWPWDEDWGRGTRPVINVSWEDATAYAQWLSEQTGQRYRLPSEAEWEYAARAGTTGPFSFDGPISTAKANYNAEFGYGDIPGNHSHAGRTVPVGSLPANPWGLHEVHGNVLEWVEDHVHQGYESAPCDGTAWIGSDSGRRMVRGGSWRFAPCDARSARRLSFPQTAGFTVLGFRLASDL